MRTVRVTRVASIGASPDDGALSTGTGALIALGLLWLFTEWGRQKLRQ